MADTESQSSMEYSEDEDDDGALQEYYEDGADDLEEDLSRLNPEHFPVECLSVEEVERLLNEWVEQLSTSLQVTPSLAKQLLHSNNWNAAEITARYRANCQQLLAEAQIKPRPPPAPAAGGGGSAPGPSSAAQPAAAPAPAAAAQPPAECPVCACAQPPNEYRALACRHHFCQSCWRMHFETQIMQGISLGIECMARHCNILVPEDFVVSLVTKPGLRSRYQQYAFADYIRSQPQLRFCPGPNCPIIIRAVEPKAKRVVCSKCKTSFCFRCGIDYHAPADCETVKKWLTKCADDSETANYISANTKDCPKCHICIEKNGGCNHMQCFSCKFEFCWMCLGNWKNHGSEYYECSRYKENPNIASDSAHAKAREALKKYLHYYERWENHSKSLALEAHTRQKIVDRINQKVNDASGTWIDWQYLLDAAALLAKCRYTLQYTYPYAYYLEIGSRKALFEYQQAQLELDIEELSWKVERAETTDRGELENHMSRVEKSRTMLLREFIEV
ncbi:putative E3 ubiquitin-protein ligase ariadne-2 [Amphibalanus amphitrite]|uniref:RBR-type E3 ubiquitin transferase n=1 Tax=Amphibalanus amphitrite TaxID=1232801 RepID=A0A6A4VRX1_AMPAM|nr:putative E3 ubiquitin-protein ligase ariadne-2 [Amphibalanus amphitrite]KAF0296935.1 putative E3 ubiquitin-protein ligase ariadne-2 [Amphibalanus amphitrite]